MIVRRTVQAMKFSFLVLFFALVGCVTTPRPDGTAIQRSMQFRQRDFIACFEENYKRPIEGKYRLTFTIGDDGTAYGASPERDEKSLPKSSLFDDCMIGILKETAFPVPASSEEVKVNYPFYFRWSPEGPTSGASVTAEKPAPASGEKPAPAPTESPTPEPKK